MRQTFASDPIGGACRETPWSRTFQAKLDQVREARRFLTAILNGHPATEKAVACVSELAANSVRHSRSADPGGTFSIRVYRRGPAIRVEVRDDGGPWANRLEDPEHGRGLKVVESLSDQRGISIQGPPDNPVQRTTWYEIWPAPTGPGPDREAPRSS